MLTKLQGLIWAKGYSNGTIKGHVYPDVPKAFESWGTDNIKMYIYSSGSVNAQKLLFGNSEHGDLTSKITGYFDTVIGAKQEKESYEKIIKEVGCDASEILFLTDIVNEAVAAKQSGMQVAILVREGNGPLTDEEKAEYQVFTSFDGVALECSTGKRKLEDVLTAEKLGASRFGYQHHCQLHIFISLPNGRTSCIEIEPYKSIRELKREIYFKEKVPESSQRLWFNGKRLENSKCLDSYGISMYSTISLLFQLCGGSDQINLNVISFDATVYQIKVEPDCEILQVKHALQAVCELHPTKVQVLRHKSQVLENHQRLSFYRINDGSILRVEIDYMISVYIVSSDAETHIITTSVKATIQQFKKQINLQLHKEIPPQNLILYLRSKVLPNNEKTLEEIDMKDGDFVTYYEDRTGQHRAGKILS